METANGVGHASAAPTPTDGPDEPFDAFIARARAFLDAHAQRRSTRDDQFEWGRGDDAVGIVEEGSPDAGAAAVAAAQRWAATRFDAGFGWLAGPSELGGAGLTHAHSRAYRAIEAEYDLPDMSVFTIGLGMVAPTIAAHATEQVCRQYLPGIHRGDVIACQLFSEPGAGSDLAAIACRAERDGEQWVLNGQKVWTSNAHHAAIGEVICMSDPTAARHHNLTAFLVDMNQPGIEVRPLRQMTGGAGFNEVFFDNARVADTHRLGDVGDGWRVAITTLMSERASIGSGMGLAAGPGPFERLIELTRVVGRDGDPLVRDQLTRLYVEHRTLALTTKRALANMTAHGLPGPEMSILKLAGTEHLLHIADFAAAVLGPRLLADTGEWGTFAWNKLVCGVPGARLGGGTDEVLRNVVGERVLGLPREPAPRH